MSRGPSAQLQPGWGLHPTRLPMCRSGRFGFDAVACRIHGIPGPTSAGRAPRVVAPLRAADQLACLYGNELACSGSRWLFLTFAEVCLKCFRISNRNSIVWPWWSFGGVNVVFFCENTRVFQSSKVCFAPFWGVTYQFFFFAMDLHTPRASPKAQR